jgi:uncharacterized membrane protein YecN with MAPEG domain
MAMFDFFWFGMHVALNALLLLLLAMQVSRLRMSLKIAYGDNGSVEMNQAIRAHANGVEHVAIYSLNLLALSLLGVSNGLMAVLVLVFFVGRLLHAFGMLKRQFTARRWGAGLTYLSEAIAVVALFVLLLGG